MQPSKVDEIHARRQVIEDVTHHPGVGADTACVVVDRILGDRITRDAMRTLLERFDA